MAEQRSVKVFKDGQPVGEEDVRVVSVEELEEEAEARDLDEKIKAILEIDWTTLPTEQVIQIVQKVIKRLFKKGVLP